MLRGVHHEVRGALDQRAAAPAAALIHDDDSVDMRIEEATIPWAAAGTGPAV